MRTPAAAPLEKMLLLCLVFLSLSTGAISSGRKCTPEVEAGSPCAQGDNQADPTDCTSYYECPQATGRWRLEHCPSGASFDSVTKRCLSPSRSVCAFPCGATIDITSTPKDLYEGGSVKIVCRARIMGSVTSYNVSWYLNNTYLLNNGSRVSVVDHVTRESIYRVQVSTLRINKLKATYSGEVQCKVTTDTGTSSKSINVSILAIPRVTMTPITVSQPIKTNFLMRCTAYVLENGHPGAYDPVQIRWYRDGDLISDSKVLPEIGLESAAPRHISVKKPVEQKDSAHSEAALEVVVENGTTRYSCIAENRAGASESDSCTVVGYQPAEQPVCPEKQQGEMIWPPTPAAVVHRLPCPESLLGDSMIGSLLKPRWVTVTLLREASRSCELDEYGEPRWLPVNMTECTDPAFHHVDQMTQQMEEGFGADNPATLKNLATSLEKLSSDDEKDGMRAGNLRVTLNALSGLARVRSLGTRREVTDKEILAVVKTVSNILSDKNKDAWKSILKQNAHHAVAVLMAVEHYAQVLSDGLHNKTMGFQSSNLLLQKETLESSKLTEQSYPDKSLDATEPWVTQSEDSLTFNKQTLRQIAEALKGPDITISSAYYRNVATLLPKSENSSVNSRILSVSVEDLPQNTRFSKPIIVKLKYLEDIEDGFYPHCSFWNFSAGSEGTWSSDGCTLIYHDKNEAWCECNHLTNFAIIISPYRPEGIHATVLSIISMVGCLISIVGLCLTTLIYAILWKQIRSHHNVIFLNLCVCLIIANILFLAGIEQTEDHVGCVTIAAFLHYLFLAVFFIMLAEGIELLLYIVFVFHIKTQRETVALLIGAWGIPAVIVGITLGITKTVGYGNDDFCWLTIENGVIWSFIAPAIVVIVANTVIIVMVLHSVAKAPSAARHREKRKDHWSKSFWNLAVLSPLLGISWIFGVFAVNQHTLVFQYIFAIFNSFQGLFIFLFHCVFNKRVKDAFRDRFKLADSSTGSTANASIRKRSSVHDSRDKRSSRTLDTTVNSSRASRNSTSFVVMSSSKIRKPSKSEINANESLKPLTKHSNGYRSPDC